MKNILFILLMFIVSVSCDQTRAIHPDVYLFSGKSFQTIEDQNGLVENGNITYFIDETRYQGSWSTNEGSYWIEDPNIIYFQTNPDSYGYRYYSFENGYLYYYTNPNDEDFYLKLEEI